VCHQSGGNSDYTYCSFLHQLFNNSRSVTIYCVTIYRNTKLQQYVSWIVHPKWKLLYGKKYKFSEFFFFFLFFFVSTTLNYYIMLNIMYNNPMWAPRSNLFIYTHNIMSWSIAMISYREFSISIMICIESWHEDIISLHPSTVFFSSYQCPSLSFSHSDPLILKHTQQGWHDLARKSGKVCWTCHFLPKVAFHSNRF